MMTYPMQLSLCIAQCCPCNSLARHRFPNEHVAVPRQLAVVELNYLCAEEGVALESSGLQIALDCSLQLSRCSDEHYGWLQTLEK